MQCQPKEVLKSIVHRTRIAPLRLTRS
jgi:hypothetical protein